MLNWLLKDKQGKIVIGQKPNWQLYTVAAIWGIQYIIKIEPWHFIFRMGFLAALCYWAILEVVSGVNGLRRILGYVVILYIVVELYAFVF